MRVNSWVVEYALCVVSRRGFTSKRTVVSLICFLIRNSLINIFTNKNKRIRDRRTKSELILNSFPNTGTNDDRKLEMKLLTLVVLIKNCPINFFHGQKISPII
jgi:hypothetical protein